MTDEERHALGIERAILGDEDMVVLPAVAEGRAALGPTVLAILAAGSPFTTPRNEVAERVAMRVSVSDQRPTVVRVSDDYSRPVEARRSAGAGDWLHHDKQDPGTVFIDLERAAMVSVARNDGRGLLLRLGGRGIFVVDFHPLPFALASLAPVQAPIDTWCQGEDDAWLVDQMKRCAAAAADSWRHAVAAGLLGRLRPVGGDAKALLTRVLSGEPDTMDDRPRSWARALSAEQEDTLVDLELAVVDRVEAALDDLWAVMAPGEPWWREAFHAACVERDDLECVRLLLIERRAGARVTAALDSLDHRGRELIAGLPRRLSIEDERLYRARLADPAAWWARLAEPESSA